MSIINNIDSNALTVQQRLLKYLQEHAGEQVTVFDLREHINAMDNTINKELHKLRRMGYIINSRLVKDKKYKVHWMN